MVKACRRVVPIWLLVGILTWLGLCMVLGVRPFPAISDVLSGMRAARLGPAPGKGIVYRESFDRGAGGWHYYATTPAGEAVLDHVPWNAEQQCVTSASPWWIDPNHKPPGAGYLNIVAFIWMKGYRGGVPYRWMDLRDAVLRFSIKTEGLDTKGGHLYFWFQHRYEQGSHFWFQNPFAYGLLGSDWKRANLALTRYPVEKSAIPGRWTQITLPLSPHSEDWTNLGSSNERHDSYGSVSPMQALAKVTTDLGFIILPVDPKDPPKGVVSLDNIEIGWPEPGGADHPRGQQKAR